MTGTTSRCCPGINRINTLIYGGAGNRGLESTTKGIINPFT